MTVYTFGLIMAAVGMASGAALTYLLLRYPHIFKEEEEAEN